VDSIQQLMHVDHAFIAHEEMWSFNVYALN